MSLLQVLSSLRDKVLDVMWFCGRLLFGIFCLQRGKEQGRVRGVQKTGLGFSIFIKLLELVDTCASILCVCVQFFTTVSLAKHLTNTVLLWLALYSNTGSFYLNFSLRNSLLAKIFFWKGPILTAAHKEKNPLQKDLLYIFQPTPPPLIAERSGFPGIIDKKLRNVK